MQLLVAEDNAEWQYIIAHILEPQCVLAGFVERGDQVLEVAQKVRPGLITLDVRMPGESGLNVLPRLRAMLPQAIIIVVSSMAAPIYKEEALARGADAYIEKGKVASELVKAVALIRERGSNQDRSHPDA
jgi:CheY-like chemotaxis protein